MAVHRRAGVSSVASGRGWNPSKAVGVNIVNKVNRP